ncbi:MAG: LysM peptidoglycan-binding domain-containing protein [Candidatus Cloacimonetes bacterium]|nr:LysM peptidoglycan-binding domain-containing protein [Candidatus Cloacimonadota bacterium]
MLKSFKYLFPLLLILIPALLSSELVTHRVESGDTLYNISKRYDVTIDQIKELNSLTDNTIRLGQVLKIKESDRLAAVTIQPEGKISLPADKLPADQGAPHFSVAIDSEGRWTNPRRIPSDALFAEDAAGSRYYAGVLSQNMSFGSFKLQSRLSAEQSKDGILADTWLACQNSDGSWRWAKNFALVKAGTGLALAVGGSGSVYAAGLFDQELEIDNQKLQAGGPSDLFLAKFDNSGKLLWLKKGLSSGGISSPILSLNQDGNIFLGGEFSGTLSFDDAENSSSGDSDLFVTMLDSMGSRIWTATTGSDKAEKLLKMELTGNGGILIYGSTQGSFKIEGTKLGELPDSADNRFFLARIEPDGRWVWGSRIQQLGTQCLCNHFSSDTEGNTWFADNFYASGKSHDIYTGGMSVNSQLTMLNAQGKKIWSKSMGGTDVSIDWISAGPNSGLFVSGSFLGSLTLGDCKLDSGSQTAQYYAYFDSKGNCLWARKWLGTNLYFNMVSSSGELYLVGKHQQYIDTGSTPHYFEMGDGDLLVTQLDGEGNWIWVSRADSKVSPDLLRLDFDRLDNLRIWGYNPGEMLFSPVKP